MLQKCPKNANKEAGDDVKWIVLAAADNHWTDLDCSSSVVCSWAQTPSPAQQKFCDESFNLISLPQHNQFDRIQYAVLSWKHGNKNNFYCNHFLSKQWHNNTALMAPGTNITTRQGVISLPAPEQNQYSPHSCESAVKVSITGQKYTTVTLKKKQKWA